VPDLTRSPLGQPCGPDCSRSPPQGQTVSHSYSRLDDPELASADDRAAVVGWQLDETSNRDAGFGPVHWLATIQRLHQHQVWDPHLVSPRYAADVYRSEELGTVDQKSNMGCSPGPQLGHTWRRLVANGGHSE